MQCKQCQQQFTIYPEDKEFYQRINVPEPSVCPDCRHFNRQQKRVQPILAEKECSMCHKKTLTAYSKEKILCEDCYLSAVV